VRGSCSLDTSAAEPESAVGFAAMLDGGDVESLAVVLEAEPVVSDAEAELWRLDVLEAFYVALSESARA
jgi:hypothetical protein